MILKEDSTKMSVVGHQATSREVRLESEVIRTTDID
jgi:hypothetical protein